MAEHVKSITDVRKSLPKFSRGATERMERYIITQHGEPQSVLLGYKEYKGLLAAAELLREPNTLKKLHKGIEEIRERRGLTFDEMEATIEKAESKKAASELAGKLVTATISGRGRTVKASNPDALLRRKAPMAIREAVLQKAKG